jgi:hypothetical protein
MAQVVGNPPPDPASMFERLNVQAARIAELEQALETAETALIAARDAGERALVLPGPSDQSRRT